MEKIVNIYGAGISGMTVAHHLIKRGFKVNVFEKSKNVGGMARSTRDENNVPNEHSWRGYGPFYYNLFNLTKEIPLNIESFTNDNSIIDNVIDQHISNNNISLKNISIDEINNTDKLYTFTNKYVFDLSNYIDNHPGGNIIMNCKGKNIVSVWNEMGYSWHLTHDGIINKLKNFVVGKLVENHMNTYNSVYDNLNKTRLNFRTLYDNIKDEKYHKYLSINDMIYLAYNFGKVITSKDRKEKYYKMRLDPMIKKNLSKYGYHYIADFVAGPGAGFDKNTMSLGHYANFAKLSYGKPAWQVMNQPTSEAWFNPWKKYLEKLGVKFYMEHSLDEIIIIDNVVKKVLVNTRNKENKLLMKGIHIIAINPNNIADIMKKSNMVEYPLYRKLAVTNNQISYRIGFNKKINFKKNYNSFVLVDSPYNITFYPQDLMWKNNVKLGMDGKILSLWSGTLILPYNKGSLYGKSASMLSKKELLDEIIYQHFNSEELKDVIINKNDFNKDNIIYTELFEDWVYNNDKMTSINKKWVNTNMNQQYRPSEKTNYNNLFITGSHCNTSVDIWSMEGAVESGNKCSKYILEKFKMKDDIDLYIHDDNMMVKLLQKLDNILYKVNGPHIIDIIIIIILYIIYKVYRKK